MKASKVILPLLLAAQTIYCWNTFYKAQFLQYDENYGFLIHGFVISLGTMIFLGAIWFLRRHLIQVNKVPIFIWILIGSPITFIVVTFNYESIFGATLAK